MHVSSRLFLAALLLLAIVVLVLGRASSDRPEAIDVEGKRSEARQALDLINTARTYPDQTLPRTGFAAAHAYAKASLQKQGSLAKEDDWEALGPTNVGGRTLALAIDPQTPDVMYAGSASGGLWRTTTGGVGLSAWDYVPTGFPVLGVAAIGIDPQNTQTIYIGTGEVYGSPESFPGIGAVRTTRGSYGIGILKTTDGGLSWTKSLDWALDQQRGVQKIRVNPVRSATVWAATTDGTYRSYDAGATWQKVHDIVMATDIQINPADTSTVFAAYGGMNSPGHGIYRSQDGGATWQKMNFGPLGPNQYFGKALLAIAASNPDIVMASIGNSNGLLDPFPGSVEAKTWLMKSVDGGDNWEVVSEVNYANLQGWYAHALAIDPTNPNFVWTAGQPFNPFYSSQGGFNLVSTGDLGWFQPSNPPPEGVSITTYPHLNFWADYHEIVYHPNDPRIIYFANDGGVFRTTNGGLTTENLNGGYQTTQFYNGFSISTTDPSFALGGLQDNSSVIYEGDVQWRRAGGGDGGWTAMNQTNNNVIYLSSQWGNISRYFNRSLGEDAPVQIRPEGLPITTTNFITPYVLSPVDNRTIYMGSEVVYRSSNEGTIWVVTNNGAPLDGNAVISMAASHQSVNVVYAATSPKVTRPHVYRTTDGNTWVDITGTLPDRLPTDLAVDPNNDQNIFVTLGGFGTSHVYKSTNGGATWVDIGLALPDVPTWSVTVDPEMPEHLFVGNDIGVFQSLDGGTTWEAIQAGLPDAVMAFELAVSPADRMLRVATHGNGVYQRPLPDPLATATEPTPVAPARVVLEPNYPNPFHATTTLTYRLAAPTFVRIDVYDIAGRLVTTLVAGEALAGHHRVAFDAGQLAAGTYLARLEAGGTTLTQTMTVVK